MITRPRRRRATLTVASLVAVVAVTTAVDAQPAGAVPLPVNIDGFQDCFYVPIDDVVLGDSGDASVVANGNLSVTWAGSTLEPTFNEDDALTEFDSDLGLRGALTLELAAETTGDLDGSLEVLTVPLTPFEAGPVIVTPYLGIDVRLDLSATILAEGNQRTGPVTPGGPVYWVRGFVVLGDVTVRPARKRRSLFGR